MKNDAKIIQLLWERSDRALEAIDQAYGKRCLQLANSILHNEQDAEECVNDAYLHLWRTIPPTTPQSIEAYLFKTVRNLSLNRIEKNTAQKRGGTAPDIPLHELEETLADLTLPEDSVALRRAINTFLATLDKRDVILFVRRYWYSDSISDLARTTGMKENTVYQRLHTLRKKLHRHLLKGGISI
ncbi:MAG: sigma-70 family RNA polymerase sigma factor [Clostridia bacterium]|nr:sigma-70 family RNA polymerase sigma factor [Clostridia bacterium]